MSAWLADCSTRARLGPGKHGHQEYVGESSEPVVRMKRRSTVGAEIIVSCSIKGLGKVSWCSAMKVREKLLMGRKSHNTYHVMMPYKLLLSYRYL